METKDVIIAVNLERKADAEEQFTAEVRRVLNEIDLCNKNSARFLKEASVWKKQLSEMGYQEPEDINIDDG